MSIAPPPTGTPQGSDGKRREVLAMPGFSAEKSLGPPHGAYYLLDTLSDGWLIDYPRSESGAHFRSSGNRAGAGMSGRPNSAPRLLR